MGIKNPAVTILRVVGIIFIIVAVINIVVGGIMFFVSKCLFIAADYEAAADI